MQKLEVHELSTDGLVSGALFFPALPCLMHVRMPPTGA